MQVLIIGIDDTDDLRGPGTGRRARGLADAMASRGLGRSLGVTRHQLLVDERIPYTSHNSALCFAFEATGSLEEIANLSRDFLASNCADGSDPGLCIAKAEGFPRDVIEFGLAAQQRVLSQTEAASLAAQHGILLEGLAGTHGGIIGALAGVGLRASGEDGRFVELPGVRALIEDSLPVGDILKRTAVHAVTDESGRVIPADELVHFAGWLRPTLRAGKPVVVVRKEEIDSTMSSSRGLAAEKGWVPIEHKNSSDS